MKYKVKQYILRAAPLILVCCMFVFALSPSASAEALDYRDYEKYVTVDGDKDIVTLEFPFEKWTDWVFLSSELYYSERYEGSSALIFPDWMSNYLDFHLFVAPFGDSTTAWGEVPAPERYLSLNNIPADAKWSAQLEIWFLDEMSYFIYNSSFVRNWMVDGDVSTIYQELPPTSIKEGSAGCFNVQFSGDIGAGHDGWYPQFLFTFSTVAVPLSVSLKSFDITMSISSLYRLQQQTGETNALLDEVNKQLAEQGKTMEEVLDQQKDTNEKLDGIINGEVNPEAPEGADKVGDLDNAEGQLRDEAQAGLDEGVQIQQNVLQILEQYANGFAVFSWLFGLFAKLPFFSGLLYVSLALGTVAALLNLGLNAQSRARSNTRKKGG